MTDIVIKYGTLPPELTDEIEMADPELSTLEGRRTTPPTPPTPRDRVSGGEADGHA